MHHSAEAELLGGNVEKTKLNCSGPAVYLLLNLFFKQFSVFIGRIFQITSIMAHYRVSAFAVALNREFRHG